MPYSGSASDRLAFVRARMEECMYAQEYETRGQKRKRMASLDQFSKLEEKLIQAVEAESNSGRMSSLGIRVSPS